MPAESIPQWKLIADKLDALVSGPTDTQRALAEALGIDLPSQAPAPVAAAILRSNMSTALLETMTPAREIPEVLSEIEEELGLEPTTHLITGTKAEVSAWFAARYMVMTVRGLRSLQPEPGDIVTSPGWAGGDHRVISSIRSDGRVIMRRHPARSAWPNHLNVVARFGSEGYEAQERTVDARIRNATTSRSTNFANYARLSEYELTALQPPPEGIRALEELLEAGEHREEPLQRVLTQYPQLLARTVVGGWRTYVVPKPRLGGELVPDFLILGLNSVGPQWVTVEIEATRHRILNRDGSLSTPTRHAVGQINDWREWLTTNVAYAQTELGLFGLTNRAPGLVVIGRDDPSAERVASRALSDENSRIAVHSWDWLLRATRNADGAPIHGTDFARDNLPQLTPTMPLLGSTAHPVRHDDLLEEFDRRDASDEAS
ncbi:DUF4263 domain-containing protein [Microbacterium fluvii]|uniref:DUF4263 domain-containing protein n=1 Tax=Microbacterium fluvii TaxID=415215 RepID=A0ABW2HB13_9MICO|nr:DUF4263 domain-containing protein [Microbacterium fluvii]MCU4671270.1 DUF4263 domain-containing protein [Microbacterium fluvii]